ncbi:MAG: PilZ domain-containing protein, partial [Burkholderiaceae bacterium]|nr:PilZ domain-containing protein [Burkholderiaceae bacterium]
IGCSFINLTPPMQADIKNFVEHLGGGRKLK